MNTKLQKCVQEYHATVNGEYENYIKKMQTIFEKILPGEKYIINGPYLEYDGFLFSLYNERLCKNALFCRKKDGTPYQFSCTPITDTRSLGEAIYNITK
jgi:hypothetical protein